MEASEPLTIIIPMQIARNSATEYVMRFPGSVMVQKMSEDEVRAIDLYGELTVGSGWHTLTTTLPVLLPLS
jgi:hypothetical protein